MRPQLRDHVLFTERPDGTHVQGPHGGMLLRGPGLHPWLSRLAPFLTGEHTLAELVAELPPGRRGMVERLVEKLARGGYVRDHTPAPPPSGPAPATREPHSGIPPRDNTRDNTRDGTHAEQLAFLGYAADRPELRLQRLREARVTVSGSAGTLPVLSEVARLGPHSGWRAVRVEVRERGGRASGARTPPPYSDLLIWVTDRGEPPPDPGPGAWCSVRLMAGAAWVGPVLGANEHEPRGARRKAGDIGEGGDASGDTETETDTDTDTDGSGGVGSGGAAGVVAAQVVLVCTRYLAGLEAGTGGEGPGVAHGASGTGPPTAPAVRVDLIELTTSEHPVPREATTRHPATHGRMTRHPVTREATAGHPAAHGAPGRHPDTRGATARHPAVPHRTAEAVSAWWASAALPEHELWGRVAPLVDPYTGVLREVTAGPWLQHPWWTCGAVLADGTRVGAHGATRESARALAVLRALAMTGSPSGPAWGWDLVAQAPRLLTGPVEAESCPAAGLSPAEAALDGVRAWAEREVARRLVLRLDKDGGGSERYSERHGKRNSERKGKRDGRPRGVRLTTGEVTARLAGCQGALPVGLPGGGARELLWAAGCEVRVFDLSAVLCGVPAYAVTLDGEPVVLRCGEQPGAALAEALGLALLSWQAAHDEDAAYAPRLPHPLPRLADTLPACGGEAATRPVGLLDGLAAAGLHPVAVPLRGGGPYVAKVVLLGPERVPSPADAVRRTDV
ncbi:hypothetical protein [Streptomyces axinellae]|uniref:YcaO domain-containing protein n=1 Tax=Streptomyces axinellae TaxID=552788 RepID=A0ABN3PZ27_9ACTN